MNNMSNSGGECVNPPLQIVTAVRRQTHFVVIITKHRMQSGIFIIFYISIIQTPGKVQTNVPTYSTPGKIQTNVPIRDAISRIVNSQRHEYFSHIAITLEIFFGVKRTGMYTEFNKNPKSSSSWVGMSDDFVG